MQKVAQVATVSSGEVTKKLLSGSRTICWKMGSSVDFPLYMFCQSPTFCFVIMLLFPYR